MSKIDHALKTHKCITVSCTKCGDPWDEEYVYHYNSIQAATRAVADAGWQITGQDFLCWNCKGDKHDDDIVNALVAALPLIAPRHNGFERISCVSIACGDCEESQGGDEGEQHYPSARHAVAAAREDGWVVTPHLVCCQRCLARRICKAVGHMWPQEPDWTTADGQEIRLCFRCAERRPDKAAAA